MNKKEKAARLFEGIGLIDDRFIEEADTYVPRRAVVRRKFAVIAALAACFSIIMVFSIGSMMFGSPSGNVTTPPNENSPTTQLSGFELVLSSGSTEERKIDIETLDLLDGRMRLIWQDIESGEYYEAIITKFEAEALRSSNSSATMISGEAVPRFRIWIVGENGETTSPELIESAGNIYYGKLFDYLPELCVSESFIADIDSILN